MSRTIPFQRSLQATRAHQAKAQLLRIPSAIAEDLALRAHLSLEAIRSACDDIAPAQHVTEVMLLVKFLAEAGHGECSHELFTSADSAMAEVFEGGRRTGIWQLSSEITFALLATIICMYDRQLRCASLGALSMASNRLDKLKAGVAQKPLQRRRA